MKTLSLAIVIAAGCVGTSPGAHETAPERDPSPTDVPSEPEDVVVTSQLKLSALFPAQAECRARELHAFTARIQHTEHSASHVYVRGEGTFAETGCAGLAKGLRATGDSGHARDIEVGECRPARDLELRGPAGTAFLIKQETFGGMGGVLFGLEDGGPCSTLASVQVTRYADHVECENARDRIIQMDEDQLRESSKDIDQLLDAELQAAERERGMSCPAFSATQTRCAKLEQNPCPDAQPGVATLCVNEELSECRDELRHHELVCKSATIKIETLGKMRADNTPSGPEPYCHVL